MFRFLLAASITGLGLLALSRTRASAPRRVRDAGPSQMRHPPAQWDSVDERADESFPASDPPGTY